MWNLPNSKTKWRRPSTCRTCHSSWILNLKTSPQAYPSPQAVTLYSIRLRAYTHKQNYGREKPAATYKVLGHVENSCSHEAFEESESCCELSKLANLFYLDFMQYTPFCFRCEYFNLVLIFIIFIIWVPAYVSMTCHCNKAVSRSLRNR